MKIIYTAEAVVEGGREGHGRTSDGRLEVDLSVPEEIGGAGGPGTNRSSCPPSATRPASSPRCWAWPRDVGSMHRSRPSPPASESAPPSTAGCGRRVPPAPPPP